LCENVWIFAMRCYASSACHHVVSVHPSVCPSVTFVNSGKTNKLVFKIFLLSGSHAILVFLYQTSWQYSDRDLPNGGVECRWGRHKLRLLTIAVWLSIDDCCSANNKCDHPPCSLLHRCRHISESVFITACSMHDHDEENSNLFVHSCKFEAELVLDVLYY